MTLISPRPNIFPSDFSPLQIILYLTSVYPDLYKEHITVLLQYHTHKLNSDEQNGFFFPAPHQQYHKNPNTIPNIFLPEFPKSDNQLHQSQSIVTVLSHFFEKGEIDLLYNNSTHV